VQLRLEGDFQEYVRSFGENANGEAYVLTSRVQGPRGSTGKVWKVVGGSVAAGGREHGS
jgi:hypothetical protein